jgi:hypothetical protein
MQFAMTYVTGFYNVYCVKQYCSITLAILIEGIVLPMMIRSCFNWYLRLKHNSQLTYPATGKGPFPGVLLIHGSGHNDKNETLGLVHKNGPKKNYTVLADSTI